MGMSAVEDLCAQPGDEAGMGKRMVVLAKREGPRTCAPGGQKDGQLLRTCQAFLRRPAEAVGF